MRYVALEMIGQNELTRIIAHLDDFSEPGKYPDERFDYASDDTVQLSREFWRWLDRWFESDQDGRLEVTAVATIDVKIFEHLATFHKRIKLNLLNPIMISSDLRSRYMTVDQILEVINNAVRKDTSKRKVANKSTRK